MAKGNDRIKEGRSRVGLLMDDEIFDVIDKIAVHEGSSRSKIMLYLITEDLGRRGLMASFCVIPWKRSERF